LRAAASIHVDSDRAPALITARGLTKIYSTADAGAVTALKDIDFEIFDGEFVSVVGQSGCGKSTLLKVLAGLLPYNAGSVELNGKPLRGPSPEAAIVFQSPVLLPWRTVLDNVLLPIEFRKLPMSSYRDSALGLLQMVGLQDFAQRYPYELSGGMQQRAAIVRALVQDPRLLLMDEPFGALDEITRDRLNEELLQVWESTGTTIVFVTHSIYEAAFLGQNVLLLAARPGRVRELVPVTLPTPRRLAMRETPEFVALAGHLRRVLETC
jgi:NitT/TauT family transport system ATP-binding protein